MPTTLVLGYDGSDTGKKALAQVADIAKHLDDGEVFVVSAFEFTIGYVPMGMTDSPLMMSAEYDQHVDLVRAACDQQIAEAVEDLEAAGVRASGEAREGKPVDVLLEAAREKQAASSSSAVTARARSRRRSSAPPRSSCCTTATSPYSWCPGTTRSTTSRRGRSKAAGRPLRTAPLRNGEIRAARRAADNRGRRGHRRAVTGDTRRAPPTRVSGRATPAAAPLQTTRRTRAVGRSSSGASSPDPSGRARRDATTPPGR